MNYLVFAFDQYYPDGGWGDCLGTAESIEEAKQIAESLATERARQSREPLELVQIVDAHRKEIVLRGDARFGSGLLHDRLRKAGCGWKWYEWEKPPATEGGE